MRGDDLERRRLLRRELVAQHILHLAHGVAGREHAVVGKPELDADEGCAQEQQHEDGGRRDGQRSAHDRRRHAMPHALTDGRGGRAVEDGPRVHPRAEHGQKCR